MRKIPPLNALRVFEAAGRYGSFTKAAEELCVTQGAVSKQIKILEEYLGMALFHRHNKKLELTNVGNSYLVSTQKALSAIEQSTSLLREQHQQIDRLYIAAAPSLSSKWLIPMLKDFNDQYPHIHVNVEIADKAMDFDREDIDIAICIARKNIWKNRHVEKLMEEELLPVCSPLLKKQHLFKTPADLVHTQLLKHTSPPHMWEEYLASIGYGHLGSNHALGFAHFYMLIPAAEDGLGVALIPGYLIEKELLAGSLVAAFDAEFHSPYYCYLVISKQKSSLKKVKLFKKWIREKSPDSKLP